MQLIFNNTFDEIIESIKYWTTIDDIPKNIINYIDNITNTRLIYDDLNNEYHCSKCFEKLDNFYCNHCKKNYEYNKDNIQHEYNADIFKSTHSNLIQTYSYGYYVFDIIENEVILYLIKQNIKYYKYHITIQELEISYALHIKKDRIEELFTNKLYIFKDIDKMIEESDVFYYDILNYFELDEQTQNMKLYLYTNNLNKLKETIYKYSYIWEGINYLKTNPINTLMITYLPIRYPQFEYLIKFKLYELAFNTPYLLKKGNTFKEIFSIEKEYLCFMQENDINYNELEALRLCEIKDYDLIKYIAEQIEIFKEIKEMTNIDLVKLKEYLDNEKFNYNVVYEYYDYIRFAQELGLNLKDKNILYPKNLIEEHDKLYLQITTKNDPNVNNRINTIEKTLTINNYEDDKYIIFAANSIESLIDESTQMSNCVRTYSKDYSEGKCQIYFMRYKNNPNKSLVTIEVKKGKVIQARTRFNGEITKEMDNVIKKWENTLTLVDIV